MPRFGAGRGGSPTTPTTREAGVFMPVICRNFTSLGGEAPLEFGASRSGSYSEAIAVSMEDYGLGWGRGGGSPVGETSGPVGLLSTRFGGLSNP